MTFNKNKMINFQLQLKDICSRIYLMIKIIKNITIFLKSTIIVRKNKMKLRKLKRNSFNRFSYKKIIIEKMNIVQKS